MSNSQMMSASFGPVNFSSLTGPSLPFENPLISMQVQLRAIRHVIQSVAFNQRRGCDALIRPVIHATGSQFLRRVLPQELAVGFAECHQHTAIARLLGIAQAFVVRANEHHAARLRPDCHTPANPRSATHLIFFFVCDVPVDRRVLHVGHHVAVGCPAPHRPVACARVGCAEREADAQTRSRIADVSSIRCHFHVVEEHFKGASA